MRTSNAKSRRSTSFGKPGFGAGLSTRTPPAPARSISSLLSSLVRHTTDVGGITAPPRLPDASPLPQVSWSALPISLTITSDRDGWGLALELLDPQRWYEQIQKQWNRGAVEAETRLNCWRESLIIGKEAAEKLYGISLD
jgi:hypothetical protein